MRRNRPQVTEIYQSTVSTDGFYKKQQSNNPKDSYQLFVESFKFIRKAIMKQNDNTEQ